MINNLVYSGVIIPGIIFTGLFLVPWIERRFTGDDREHHLLDRPRDAPHRTAAGAAAITFVAVLFLGGSQDVIAGTLDISIGHVTTFLQIAAARRPADRLLRRRWRLCRALAAAAGPERTERAGGVVRDAGGGYHAADDEEPSETSSAEPAEAPVGRRRWRRVTPPRWRRRSPSRPTTSTAIWDGFLLARARRRRRSSPCSSLYRA